MKLFSALAAAALLAPALALAEARDTPPLLGDVHRGGQSYRLNCASCHGATGQGDGFLAPQLRSTPDPIRTVAFGVGHTDAELFETIRDGSANRLMPAFGKELSPLQLWDLVAWLRSGQLQVLDFFPQAGRYLVKRYTLDSYGLARLEKAVGSALPPDQRTLKVVTVFNGEREPGEPALLEPDDPVTLDTLKPKDKLGYLVFVPVQLEGEARPLITGIATDVSGKILRVRTVDDSAGDPQREKALAAYVGLGHKGAHAPLKPAVTKKPARKARSKIAAVPVAPLAAMDAAYARALEAITMYDKEERDRTWADAPSK